MQTLNMAAHLGTKLKERKTILASLDAAIEQDKQISLKL
jgi:enoyl-CoA hydratase